MENEKSKNALLAIESQGKTLAQRAEAFIITDNKSLQEANELFQICKAFIEAIHKHLDPIREHAHKAWKNSLDEIDRREEPFKKVQGIIKPKIIAYKIKIQEAIRKKEEKARAKIQAEKEKQEQLLKESEALENAGDYGRADEKLEEAVGLDEKVKASIEKMAKIPKAPETKGTVIRKIPRWKLINLAEVPRDYMRLDEVKVGTAVRASKGTVKIPGIEVYFESV
jgi:hypothetical protein